MNDLLYKISLFLDRHFSSHDNHLFNARLSRLHELAPYLTDKFNKTGLLLGESIYGRVMQVLPTEKQKELGHMLLVGRTRGGKGLNIESQLYTWPHSVIVNDIKGELHKRTSPYRSTLGRYACI